MEGSPRGWLLGAEAGAGAGCETGSELGALAGSDVGCAHATPATSERIADNKGFMSKRHPNKARPLGCALKKLWPVGVGSYEPAFHDVLGNKPRTKRTPESSHAQRACERAEKRRKRGRIDSCARKHAQCERKRPR